MHSIYNNLKKTVYCARNSPSTLDQDITIPSNVTVFKKIIEYIYTKDERWCIYLLNDLQRKSVTPWLNDVDRKTIVKKLKEGKKSGKKIVLELASDIKNDTEFIEFCETFEEPVLPFD